MSPIEVNDDTKNWLKVGLALKHLKNGLVPFVSQHISMLHTAIIRHCGSCNACSTENVLPCPTPGICRCKHKRCQYHDQGDPHKQARLCPSSICEKVSGEIENNHVFGRPTWKNTDATKWASDAWEIAKCFMPPGSAGNHSALETDCTAILSLCLNCKPIEVAITPVKGLVEKNRNNRNLVMHSGRQELTDTERAGYIQDAIDLLAKYQTPVDSNTQKCIDTLTELNKDGFILTTDDIVDVMKSAVKAISEHQEAFKNELAAARAVVEETKTSIDQLQVEKIDKETCMKEIMELDNRLKTIDSKLQTIDETARKEVRTQMEAVRKVNESLKTDVYKHIDNIEDEVKQLKSVQTKEAKKRKQLRQEVDKVKSKIAKQDEQIPKVQLDVQRLESKMEVIYERSTCQNLKGANPDTTDTNIKPLTLGEKASMKTKDQQRLHDHLVAVYKKTCSKILVAPPKRGMSADIQDHFRKQDMKQVKMPHEPNGDKEENASIGGKCMTKRDQVDNLKTEGELKPKRDQQDEIIDVKSYEDIFNRKGNARTCQNIYIKGEAGSGKSVFCQNMVNSWCNINYESSQDKVDSSVNAPFFFHKTDKDTCFLKKFDFLFYIQLRYATQHRDIISMIKELLLMKDEHLQNVLTDVLQTQPEKCLVLLDGLDEWAPPKESSPAPHVTRGLPGRNLTTNWTVLTTTRPWKLELIRPEPEEMDQLIELSGLTQYSARECIDSVIAYLNTRYNKDKRAYECRDHLNRKKLDHFMTLPVLLKQLVCIWFDKGHVGNTRCDVYAGMIEVFLRYAEQRQGSIAIDTIANHPSETMIYTLPPCLNERDDCLDYKEQLYTLSVLAFHTLVSEHRESALVFNSSMAKIYGMPKTELNMWLNVGLLSQDVFDEQSATEQKRISFPHKSIQEFLAALHIAIRDDEKLLKRIRQFCSTVDMVLELSQVFVFVAGMRPDIFTQISEHIANVVSCDADIQNYRSGGMMTDTSPDNRVLSVQNLMLQCVQESRDNKHMSIGVHFQDLIIRHGETNNPCLVELMQVNKSAILSIKSDRESTERKRELSKGFTDILQTDISNVMTLSLHNLSFSFIPFTETAFFRQFKQLRFVHFHGLQLTHHQVQHILSLLAQNKEMKTVALSELVCTDCSDRCGYRLDLSQHESLQTLQLLNPFVMYMQKEFMGDTHLYGCHLDLTRCTKLKYLYLASVCTNKVLINTNHLETCRVVLLRASDAAPPRYDSALPEFGFNGSAERLMYLDINDIYLKHDHLHGVISFVLQSTSLRYISLVDLRCVDCNNTCEYQLDLANHTELRELLLNNVNINSLGCKICNIRSTNTAQSGTDLGMTEFEFVGAAEALVVITLSGIDLKHAQFQDLISFLMDTRSLNEIYLSNLRCVDCGNLCKCRLDLSQSEHIKFLNLKQLHLNEVKANCTYFNSSNLHVNVLDVDAVCLWSYELHVIELTVHIAELKNCSIYNTPVILITDGECPQPESAIHALQFDGSNSGLMELELSNIHLKHEPFHQLMSFLCRKSFWFRDVTLSEIKCVDCPNGCSCELYLYQSGGNIRLSKLNLREIRVSAPDLVADSLCVNLLKIDATWVKISNVHVNVMNVNSSYYTFPLRRCVINNITSHNCDATIQDTVAHEFSFTGDASTLNILELSDIHIPLKHDDLHGLMVYMKNAIRIRKVNVSTLRCMDCGSDCDSLLDLWGKTELRMLELHMLRVKEIKVRARYIEASDVTVDALQVECKDIPSSNCVYHATKLKLSNLKVNHLQLVVTQLNNCTIANISAIDYVTSPSLTVFEFTGTTEHLYAFELSDITLRHDQVEHLKSFLTTATHVGNLKLSNVTCVCCNVMCLYQLDLSDHKHLSYLTMGKVRAREELIGSTHQVQVRSPLSGENKLKSAGYESCTNTPVEFNDSQPLQQNTAMSVFEFICTASVLRYIQLSEFALKHDTFRGLMSVLARTTYLRSITLSDLKCVNCGNSCESQLDLSEHSLLERLKVEHLHVSKVTVNTTHLQECTLTNLKCSSIEYAMSDSNTVTLVFIGDYKKLRKLNISNVILHHGCFEQLVLSLNKAICLTEIALYELRCGDCDTTCMCTCLLDLSEHTQLERLQLEKSHVGQVHVNTTRLEACVCTNVQNSTNPNNELAVCSFQFSGTSDNLTTVTLSHINIKYDQFLELMAFLTKAIYLNDITVSHIGCMNYTNDGVIWLDLSNHERLRKLKLNNVQIDGVTINTTRLKVCTLVNVRSMGNVNQVSVRMTMDKTKHLNKFVLGNAVLKHDNLDSLVSFLTNAIIWKMSLFDIKCSDCDEECSCLVRLTRLDSLEYDEGEEDASDGDDDDDDDYDYDYDEDNGTYFYSGMYVESHDSDSDTDFEDDESEFRQFFSFDAYL